MDTITVFPGGGYAERDSKKKDVYRRFTSGHELVQSTLISSFAQRVFSNIPEFEQD